MLRGPALHMRLLVLIILNNRIEQQHSVDDVPPGLGRSDVHLAAEDRMSELDEMRSEVSASTAAYCHSSLDSVRRALAKTRR